MLCPPQHLSSVPALDIFSTLCGITTTPFSGAVRTFALGPVILVRLVLPIMLKNFLKLIN